MFLRRITLFRIFGFEVRLDASWIVIAVLVTLSLAASAFPHAFPGLSAGSYWLMGLFGALGFFTSILLHELSHCAVARHHRLPLKGVTLFIFGGVAEMGAEPQTPRVEFLMAIAGPAASILLGFIFYVIQAALPNGPVQVAGVFAYLAWINWILAAFNLIPAFPLDGGRVLRATLWHWKGDLTRATAAASRIGSGFGFVLMGFAIYQLLFGYLFSAVWYFLIGSFLRRAAQMSYQQVLLRSALAGEPVRRFMRSDPVTVSPDTSIRRLVDDYLYRYDAKVYPVVGESQEVLGCVTAADIRPIPKDEWDQHTVSEVVEPCTDANTVGPDTDALNALTKIRENGANGLLVTERNHLLAVISPKDVVNFLATKLELEGRSSAGLLGHGV